MIAAQLCWKIARVPVNVICKAQERENSGRQHGDEWPSARSKGGNPPSQNDRVHLLYDRLRVSVAESRRQFPRREKPVSSGAMDSEANPESGIPFYQRGRMSEAVQSGKNDKPGLTNPEAFQGAAGGKCFYLSGDLGKMSSTRVLGCSSPE